MQFSTKQHGFTLIEMIVSLAIFGFVSTVAVGALLMLVATNEQLQKQQSIMTNLSFVLDSMTREIRTGTYYYCSSRPNYAAGGSNNIFSDNDLDDILDDDEYQNCTNGLDNNGHSLQGISFVEGGDSITGVDDERVLYFYDRDTMQMYRRKGTEEAQSIVSSGVNITHAEFFVFNSAPLTDGDDAQAVVRINLTAEDATDPTAEPYHLQTTVTQRTYDI
jgi:prepilin-type N-terminal cleavage/methylation domain-containing protein